MREAGAALIVLNHRDRFVGRADNELLAKELRGVGMAKLADWWNARAECIVAGKVIGLREPFTVVREHVMRSGFGRVPGFIAFGRDEHGAQLRDRKIIGVLIEFAQRSV